MALFQKRPQTGETIQFYTLGKNNTVLIVGLGNVGNEYEGTRHNVGFAVVDAFASRNDFPAWINKKDLKCHLTQHTIGDTRVILIKPTTFMNLSGEAVQAVANFYKIMPANIVVVHDELDIPFGQLRMRLGGSSAGQNGVKSVIQHIGEQFGRVRVGIGPKTPEQMDAADFVLARFNKEQEAHLGELVREANAVLSEYVFSGQALITETRSFLI
ncbi:MAG TPA: aminoacyl-tRNA hydrolase [Candidatus Saccharimonadales bacterium]|nr:aminoacyl-tRNA hydrolase [Candidatus Saccharimonadales bacterium]